ncbi:MAG: response regulator [Desulfobulbaceae bacterium]
MAVTGSSPKILIADDDELVRNAVEKILNMFDYQVVAVDSGRDVLKTVSDEFAVIILDINMPDMDGFETLDGLNKMQCDIPVLFLTGAGSMDYAIRAINLGAYDFMTKPIEDIELFHVKIRRAIEKRNYVLKERNYRKNLEEEVREKTRELAEKNRLLREYSSQLEEATVQVMSSLQAALEEKDMYTAGHTQRVTEYSLLLGKGISLTPEETVILERAAHFHDIGKLVIDLTCIQKPGKLTEEEWALIKKHPEVGANIIQPFSFASVEREIILHHHERIDGNGYPHGIGGDEINLLTRIVTIADSYDAMTSRRNYRRNLTTVEAVEELRRCAGTQFDPDLVDVFADLVFRQNTAAAH